VNFANVARKLGAVLFFSSSLVASLSVVGVGLGGCSSDPAPEAAKDFCGVAASSNTKCTEPNACDTQLASDCTSLDKALSASTVAAAKDCLESGICGVASCLSRAQKSSVASAAHKKLAEDFCTFCAPSLQDCTANFYKRGSKSAGLAVLPYSDDIVTAVDDECTGQAGCQAKFTTCARDVIAAAAAEKVDPATADCITQGFGSDGTEVVVGPDGRPQAVTCTPANCQGCCRDDKCEKGDTSDSCGTAAKACETCSATSKCTSGACKEPCGPNTCKGCCNGETCVEGGSAKDACGEDGAACAKCDGQFVCSNHTCIDGSCQATCTNGCCSAAGCQTGTAASACGTGGEACVDCGVGRTCTAAACQLDRTSLWDVYISFAVVPEKSHSNLPWDALGGAPDPFLNVFTSEGTSTHSGSTTSVTDSTVPFWAETPVKGVKASELLANTSVEIWDYDVLDPNDYIGGCALPLTPAVFDGSLQNYVCPATASTVSVTVYYRINPHVP
jgi:hypothetical protein